MSLQHFAIEERTLEHAEKAFPEGQGRDKTRGGAGGGGGGGGERETVKYRIRGRER